MIGLENRSHSVFVLKGTRNPFCSFDGENFPTVPKIFVKIFNVLDNPDFLKYIE